MILQDDGQGAGDTTGGYGLLGVRERVELLQGHLESPPRRAKDSFWRPNFPFQSSARSEDWV